MQEITWNRTDLIDETAEVVFQSTDRLKENLNDERGIKIEEWQQNRVKITKVEVNAIGEEKVHKKQGTYVTLSIPTLTSEDRHGFSQMQESLTHYLQELHKDINITAQSKILVIGLGNKTITPDAIGP